MTDQSKCSKHLFCMYVINSRGYRRSLILCRAPVSKFDFTYRATEGVWILLYALLIGPTPVTGEKSDPKRPGHDQTTTRYRRREKNFLEHMKVFLTLENLCGEDEFLSLLGTGSCESCEKYCQGSGSSENCPLECKVFYNHKTISFLQNENAKMRKENDALKKNEQKQPDLTLVWTAIGIVAFILLTIISGVTLALFGKINALERKKKTMRKPIQSSSRNNRLEGAVVKASEKRMEQATPDMTPETTPTSTPDSTLTRMTTSPIVEDIENDDSGETTKAYIGFENERPGQMC